MPKAIDAPSNTPTEELPRRSRQQTPRDTSRIVGRSDAESSAGLDTVAVALGLVIVALLFQCYAPDPYMDEPFHVPQTQKYCRGEFSAWDPKITTFPGLYILGAFIGRLHNEAFKMLIPASKLAHAELCGTAVLRSANVGLGATCFWLCHALYMRLHPGIKSDYATQVALAIVLLPTHFFYTFLYYTDTGSLALVLASLLATLHQRYLVSGLTIAAAVLFRQTNAVWACFVLMVAILERFFRHNKQEMQAKGLAMQIATTVKLCWLNKAWLLAELWPLLSVPAAFAGFVVWNGGIVVGDRKNHTPVLHLVQPLYFLFFAAAVLGHINFQPSRLSEAFWLASRAFRRKPMGVMKPFAMTFVLAGYAVHYFSLAHPFLLADNRHYTFYLWKDIIAPYPAAKYCLIPLYLYSGWSLRDLLRAGGQLDIWTASLAFCTVTTLVPAWLLEFRYFTTPTVLVMLHINPPSRSQLLLTIASFALVNAVTLYVFLLKPFVWNDGSIARFMW